MRETARTKGDPVRYDGRWRDRDPAEAPVGIDPTVRFRAPREGETVIADLVQGDVRFAAKQLDDMVLLRGDGTLHVHVGCRRGRPRTWELTHVIRGVDHLTNAARQTQLFHALRDGISRSSHTSH